MHLLKTLKEMFLTNVTVLPCNERPPDLEIMGKKYIFITNQNQCANQGYMLLGGKIVVLEIQGGGKAQTVICNI